MKNNEINAFNESTNYYNKISDQAIKKFGSIHKKEALEFIAKNMKAYYKNNSINCISNVKFETK
tara:strand:- start:203 stop:394 length:192 start_codon:yes stop_codon:yes gene_type:complete